MNITLQVGQGTQKNQMIPQFIACDLFAITPLSIEKCVTAENLCSNIISFQTHVLHTLKKSDKGVLDQVKAVFQACLDFKIGTFEKNYNIKIPLTLFMLYKHKDLEDITNHIFLKLVNQWQTFYKEYENTKGAKQ